MKSTRVRLWEVLPGLFSWGTIIGLLTLAFVAPSWLAIIVLVYTILWLIKVFIITGHLAVGFWEYRHERTINWFNKLTTEFPEAVDKYYHLTIVPTTKEDISILRHTLNALRQSNYKKEQLMVAVTFEQRYSENIAEYTKILTHEFEQSFGLLFITAHPSDIEGEIKGKGPNITWAGRQAKELLDKKGISYDDVIVTTLDSDNRVDKEYFANLTWLYVQTPDPIHKSFQPLPMYFNNIWKVPLAMKVMALGSSFWQIVQAMRPRYSRNFSAHSQSMAGLVEADFWSVKTIVEDGHQYWRSYFAFNGNHHVVPMFVPIYMDAVEGESLYETFREQYLQRRRWYWGVSDIPFVFDHTYANKKIPFWYKWLQFTRLVESHYSLATQSFILLIGWLPLAVNPGFSGTIVGHSFPIVYRGFLSAAWIGMIVNMIVASMLVPPRPGRRDTYLTRIIFEWILAPIIFPVTGVMFSALPALDSQTRLLINRPFTVFNATKKIAVESGIVSVEN